MKRHLPARSIGLALAGLILLGIAGSRHAPLVEARKTHHLQAVPPEDTTPMVALITVAFGGFRGLVADALWVRANDLQQEGEYFELVQLAKWITQLEPRVPEVWSFQSWNLAYNISVLFTDEEDKWRWVNHGIDLLRHEGLTHNPTSASLHWDLGWMFQHKIGMNLDLSHVYYKRRLAEQIHRLFDGGRLTEATLTPKRRAAVRQEFAMDTDAMLELEQTYGPLDWRVPETHSLYWSSRGLALDPSPFLRQQLERMRLHSLTTLVRQGRLLYSPENSALVPLPRPDLIATVRREYGHRLRERPRGYFLQSTYDVFLREALLLHAEYARLETARDLYADLAERHPEISPGREAFQEFVQQALTRHPSEMSRPEALTRVVALILLSEKWEDGNEIRARGMLRMARQTHRLYQESRGNDMHRERTGLPEFDLLHSVLSNAEIPETFF